MRLRLPLLICLVGCGPPADPGLARITIDGVVVKGLDADHWRTTHATVDGTVRVVVEPVDPKTEVALCARSFDGAVERCQGVEGKLDLDEVQRLDLTLTARDARTADFEVVLVPDALPVVRVETLGEATEGSWFVGIQGQAPNYGLVVDADGIPEWYLQSSSVLMDLRANPDGSVSFVQERGEGPSARRVGVVMTPDFVEQRTWEAQPLPDGSEVFMDHHDFQLLDNGNALILGLVATTEDLRPWGGPSEAELLHNVVQEVDPTGVVVWSWSTKGVVSLDDVVYFSRTRLTSGFEYSHVNSMALDAADGNLVVSCRLTNQVLKVARGSTVVAGESFEDGEVVWRLGGRSGEIAMADPREGDWMGFSAQHTAIPIDGGVMVYDNSLRVLPVEPFQDEVELQATGDSRYVAYALDIAAGTATVTRSYALDGMGFTRSMGSVQGLSNGHRVIGWGDRPSPGGIPVATEVDDSDQPVQELWLEPDGRYSYRVFKFVRKAGGWESP